MKKTKSTALVACAVVLAAALAAAGFKGLITKTVESGSGVAYEQKVDSVAFGFKLEQDFVPQYAGLDAVRIHVDASACARESGELQVSILNEHDEQVFLSAVPVSGLPQYGWVEVPVHTRLEPGQVNTLILESVGCVDNGPKISFLDSRLAAAAEQQGFHLVYAGMDVEQSALKAAFIYAVPIEIYDYFAYFAFGLMLVSLIVL